jgi:hypothetical protein
MTLNRLALFFCAALALTAGTTAEAALFFSDHFNYANGDLTDVDKAPGAPVVPGDNVSGGLWNDHSGASQAETITVINGQAELITSGSEDANRSIADPVGGAQTSGTWYYSALVTVNDIRETPGTTAILNEYFIHFKDSGNNFRSRVYVGNPSTGTGGAGFRFGLSATSGGQTDVWGTDLAFGTQYAILASYNFDTGASELWVDPINAASTSIVSAAPDVVGPGTFTSALGLRQVFISGTPANPPNTRILIDAVAMGDSFASVLAAIPEPTSGALALAGGSFVALARRRRS